MLLAVFQCCLSWQGQRTGVYWSALKLMDIQERLEPPMGKLQNGSPIILSARDGAWILDQSITPASGCMGRKYVGLDNPLGSFEGTYSSGILVSVCQLFTSGESSLCWIGKLWGRVATTILGFQCDSAIATHLQWSGALKQVTKACWGMITFSTGSGSWI